MATIRKEQYRGYTITLAYDEYPTNPREWGNVATFVCRHRRYDFGDRQDIDACIDELVRKYVDLSAYDDGYIDDLTNEEKLDLVGETNEVLVIPISIYDHSGVAISLGEMRGWDCGVIGFAYMERATAIKAGAPKDTWKEWAERRMGAEMETYNQYVQGEVYMYIVTDRHQTKIAACSVFFSEEAAIEYAQEDIDAEFNYRQTHQNCTVWYDDSAGYKEDESYANEVA